MITVFDVRIDEEVKLMFCRLDTMCAFLEGYAASGQSQEVVVTVREPHGGAYVLGGPSRVILGVVEKLRWEWEAHEDDYDESCE